MTLLTKASLCSRRVVTGSGRPSLVCFKRMYHDYCMERLIRLGRTHMQERLAHSRLEIKYRSELSQQFRGEQPFFANPFERALLIQRQADHILELSEDKQRRREALRQRQSQEVYSLLRLKMSAVDPLVTLAAYHDQ